jgi:putative transposase
MAQGQRHAACARGSVSSPDPGEDRALASDAEEKNRILLDNYYLPGDLERQIGAFVEHYNHVRYHESIDNLTPADVYFGRAETIQAERQRIKRHTIANRRLLHRLQAA